MIRFPLSILNDRAKGSLPDINFGYNPFICGGLIRQMVMGVPQDTDIDLFFRNQEDRDNQLATLKLQGFTNHWSNEMVTALSRGNLKVQLITLKYAETIESHLEDFDFTICQFGLDLSTMEIVTTPEAMVDLTRKALVINKITYPVASLRRMLKYASYGFKPCNGTLTDLALACQRITNIEDLPMYVD